MRPEAGETSSASLDKEPAASRAGSLVSVCVLAHAMLPEKGSQPIESRSALPISIIVLSFVLAIAFIGAGVTKLAGQSAMRDAATHFGIPWERYRLIGVLEVAGAAGVLLGLAVTALGAVAAIALMLLMIAAITNHRRVGDPPSQMAPATVLGLLSAVTAVLYLTH
jgi:uncharacterized membrane protein YphA (DoxX/SURF4 family)